MWAWLRRLLRKVRKKGPRRGPGVNRRQDCRVARTGDADNNPAARERRGFFLLNQMRLRYGRSELRFDPRLEGAARILACRMALTGQLRYYDADGRGPAYHARDLGYRAKVMGGSAALGPVSAEAVLEVWRRSKFHRRNLLGGWREAGLALVYDVSGRPWWVLVLAEPAGERAPDVVRQFTPQGVEV